MIVFEDSEYPTKYADAILQEYEYNRLDSTKMAALTYLTQFIDGPSQNKILLRGYLPEKYVDSLLQINTNNYYLESAIQSICRDHKTEDDSMLQEIHVDLDSEPVHSESKRLYQITDDSEILLDIDSLFEVVITNHSVRESIELYFPQETVEFLKENSSISTI